MWQLKGGESRTGTKPEPLKAITFSRPNQDVACHASINRQKSGKLLVARLSIYIRHGKEVMILTFLKKGARSKQRIWLSVVVGLVIVSFMVSILAFQFY